MPRRHPWRLLLITLLVLPGWTLADGDSKRAALARLNHEIEAHEPLIREAELQADPDARIRFQYDWLRRDIRQIRFAIGHRAFALVRTRDLRCVPARAQKKPVPARSSPPPARAGGPVRGVADAPERRI